MGKEVQQIVTETILLLKTRLLTELKPKTKEDAEKVVHDCLQVAFSEVSKSDYQTLYKKLSIQLHPDKLKNAQPELFTWLQSINAETTPQQMLNEFKEQKPDSFFEHIASDPVNNSNNLMDYLLDIFTSVFNEYKRYPEPISTIAEVLITVLVVALHLGSFVLGCMMSLLHASHIHPFILLEEVIVNLLTGFRYYDEHGFHADHKGFYKIGLFAKSIADAIKEPLSDEPDLQLLQLLLVKPLQVLMAPFILAACVLIEVVNYTYTMLMIAANIVLFAIALTLVIILNTPLYILDAVNFLINAIQSCLNSCSDSINEVNKEESYNNGQAMRQLMAPESQTTNNPPELGEQGSYGSFFKSLSTNAPSFPDNPGECSRPSM